MSHSFLEMTSLIKQHEVILHGLQEVTSEGQVILHDRGACYVMDVTGPKRQEKHNLSLLYILTSLAYGANAIKRVISNDTVNILKARGKRALADVNCYCEMTSIVALNDVTSFLA